MLHQWKSTTNQLWEMFKTKRGIPKQTSEFQFNFRIPIQPIHPVRLVSWKLNTLRFGGEQQSPHAIILWRSVSQDPSGGYQLWKNLSRLNLKQSYSWWLKSQTTTWDGAPTLFIMGKTTNLNWLAGFQPSTVSGFEHFGIPLPQLWSRQLWSWLSEWLCGSVNEFLQNTLPKTCQKESR